MRSYNYEDECYESAGERRAPRESPFVIPKLSSDEDTEEEEDQEIQSQNQSQLANSGGRRVLLDSSSLADCTSKSSNNKAMILSRPLTLHPHQVNSYLQPNSNPSISLHQQDHRNRSNGNELLLGDNSQEDDSRFESMSLDDLDIIKTIGIGTFGKVVLSQDTRTGEYYALKVLSLFDIIQMKQLEHIRNERDMLKAVRSHPFIVNLKWHSKDEYNIYFLMEFACGGELFSYLRKAGKFSASTCAFYSAEIVSALEFLHSKNIAHRDLKPENLLLDKEGHLKITDFGFAKRFRDKTWTICGTPEYLAPEVIQQKGYTKAVDWWALGVLIYEMLAGFSPFYNENKLTTYEKIMSGKVEFPKNFDSLSKELVKRLLVQDRNKRLGCKNGAEDVKSHKFFREFDWEEVNRKKLTPPIIPKMFYPGDTQNFEDYPDSWRMRSITEDELELFADF